MAQCKDCIHEKVCLALIKYGLPWNDEKYSAEKLCFEFLNKADVVPKSEVAREIFEGIWELVLAKSFFGEDSVILHIDEGEYERFKKKYTESVIVGEWEFDDKLHTEQPDIINADIKFIGEDGHIINQDDGFDWNEAPPYEESEGKG